LYKRAYQITQTEDMDCLISTDEFKEEVWFQMLYLCRLFCHYSLQF
jgi:hypothetical protein